MHEDADVAGGVVKVGGVVTTIHAAEAEARGAGEGQHQQHPNGHAPRGMGGETTLPAPSLLADGHRAVVALLLRRTATIWPPLPRVRPRGMRHL